MSIPVLIKTLVEKKLDEFCKKKVPSYVLDKVNLSYKIRGNSVSIFENRAPWDRGMKEWTSMAIAKIKFDERTGDWTLFWTDRNDKLHKYMDIEPTKNIDKILAEIDEDPTGIFWG